MSEANDLKVEQDNNLDIHEKFDILMVRSNLLSCQLIKCNEAKSSFIFFTNFLFSIENGTGTIFHY